MFSKVCGMKYAQNIKAVATLPIQYMGFIFYPPSPRNVEGLGLKVNLPKTITPVAVVADRAVLEIISICESIDTKTVQLHGKENSEIGEELKEKGFTTIKAFSVNDDFNFSDTDKYKAGSDYFLFDTKGKKIGGNGVTFNWKVLSKYNQETPFFLSGGISLEHKSTVKEEWLKQMNIHALDLNSGFEREPALKEVEKLKEFLK